MKILCTEGKSVGELKRRGNMVRVFVDNDLNYGYWVEEDALLGLLEVGVQHAYLKSGLEFTTDVSKDVAQKIIDMGLTPFKKTKLG